jgi:deazaflavin-dependent oxidoreductase (nitroreductase family)
MQVKLTTVGRKSSQPRVVTLNAFKDGDRLVVVGSWAGASKDPAWALNLRAQPHVIVGQGTASRDVIAREVEGGDRDRLWRLVSTEFPLYETYQKRTKRVIPLFVLEPPTEV